jgi:nitric oxide reductase NorD protein
MPHGSERSCRSIDRVGELSALEPRPWGQDSLSLFASAVAGKPVPMELTRRTVGASDGSTIYLPSTLDLESAETRRLVICLASLMRSGAYRKKILRKLARGGADLSRRYLLLEVSRSCGLLEPMLPRSFNAALQQAVAGVRPSGSASESLTRARSTETLPAAPTWFGELRPASILSAGNGLDGGEPSADDAALAASLTPDEEEDDGDDDAAGDRSRIMELFSAPMRNPVGEAFQKLLGMGRSAGEGAAGDEIPIVGARRSRGSSDKGRLVPGAGQPRVEMAGELVIGAAYPEWDTHRGTYREDWALVGEFDPAPVDGIEARETSVNRTLIRALARLGLAWEEHRREPMGDNLDLSALVELRTNIAAGHGGEARVYTASRKTSQRLGVLILLDATGSTAETSEGEMIFAAQRDLALELTSALDRLGARVATYGFYSRGRRNVRFLHAKSFDEGWSASAQRRLLSIRPSGFTRLGAAIRHATNVVATRAGTDHQLIVVIGDGVVYDDGYESRYATEDARFAIEEAAARGVAIVGLSVCPTPDESVWPASQHQVVRDAEQLATHVRDLFGAALVRARGARNPTTARRRSHVGTGV